MTQEQVGYLHLALIVAGFFMWALASARGRVRQWVSTPGLLDPWPLRLDELMIFALYFLALFYVSPGLAGPFMIEDISAPTAIEQALLNLVSQAGGLAAWAIFRFRPGAARPSRERGSNAAALTSAPVAFLLLFPFFYLSATAWPWLLQSLGIEPELQPIVKLVQSIDTPLEFVAWFALTTVLAPVMEELVFRSVVFRALLGWMPPLRAAALSGTVFALVHWNLQSFVPLAVLGTALALVYHRTGRILAPILLHAIFNAHSMLQLLLGPGL